MFLYVIDPRFEKELRNELGEILWQNEDILASTTSPDKIIFAQDSWINPQYLSISSIKDAVNQLKPLSPYWYMHPLHCVRRSKLIEEQLRTFKKSKALPFPLREGIPSIGVFGLLNEHTIIYATQRTKPAPDGRFNFIEDKTNPPNRAYLKLWEALTLLGKYPQAGDFALDLGASPGGWTYVLQSCGAEVLAIDKAPLDNKIAKLPGVKSSQVSAFSLKPSDFTHIDWLVCDMACYPERLYEWIVPWIESKKVGQYILTLKLQGETDFSILNKFNQIPGGRVLHLYHNKHEATFFYGS